MANHPTQASTALPPAFAPVSAPDALERAKELSCQIFGAPVAIEMNRDPEYPQDEFTLLVVEPSGDIERLLELECEWIRRMAEIVPGLTSFRLAIRPK
ncbi:MAG TPA: hypothetical protein VFI31_14125 [Pirellulales bacterium]|nr:hypothetical protein [Pirellulales bacterium]